jgi:hypothetical protein
MEAAFTRLLEASLAARGDPGAAALDLFFYWIHFAPLTRGTAAVGYMALYAALLAADLQPPRRVPPGVQLDWEALLEGDPARFRARMNSLGLSAWMRADPSLPVDPDDWWGGSLRVDKAVRTLADMLDILSLPYEDPIEDVVLPSRRPAGQPSEAAQEGAA